MDASPSATQTVAETMPSDSAGMPERLQTAELDPVKQKQIWDAEHMAFLLETYFGKPLVASIKKRSLAPLESALMPDARIQLPGAESIRFGAIAGVTETRVPERSKLENAGPPDLLNRARSILGRFETIESGKLRVLHLKDFEDKRRWEAQLWLRVTGDSQSSERLEHISLHRAVFEFDSFDVAKESLKSGARVTTWIQESGLFRTGPTELMKETTEEAGLKNLPILDNWTAPLELTQEYRFQMAAEDFNRDGWLDLAVATEQGTPILLQSDQGKRFVNVTARMGFQSWHNHNLHATALATWIDYDNDAFPDLILGEELFHNDGGEGFTRVTREMGISFRHSPMSSVVFDYDCDGWLDLYVCYQTPPLKEFRKTTNPWVGDAQSGGRNTLWRNLGGKGFEDVTETARAGAGLRKSFAAAALFLDDDRFPDLYVANDFGRNVLLRNRGDGTFEDVTRQTGSGDYATSMGVATGDLDNDGSPEIYVANMFSKMGRRIIGQVQESDYPEGIYQQIQGSCVGNRLYTASDSPGDAFREIGPELGVNQVGWAYAPSMTDLNGDGWLDLYSTTGFISRDRAKPDG